MRNSDFLVNVFDERHSAEYFKKSDRTISDIYVM